MTDEASKLAHEELLVLYQVTVGDLANFKTQQWASTNYAFLLLAGIVGVRQLSGGTISLLERLLFVALGFVVAAGAFVVLQKLQDSIEVRQARLNEVRKHFSPTFNAVWAAKVKHREFIGSIWFLRGAIVAGTLIVTWLILGQ